MGLFDVLKNIAQPEEDEDSDLFEGADLSFKPQPKQPQEERPSFITAAQSAFESSFGDSGRATEVQPQSASQPAANPQAENTSIFGNFGRKKAPRAPKAGGRQGMMNFGGKDTSVMLFSPKSFDEAGELVGYLMQNLTVVMTLEGVPAETARRLLDFMSGIAFALQGKITPVSAKTYFVTPQNVDILGTATEQPESSGAFF